MQKTSRQTPMNIVLVGFMGTGKSTIALGLARSLGFEVVDTDELIVDRESKSVNEIFASVGEESFRDLESELLRTFAGREGLVISTGGGIVTRQKNIDLLRALGIVFWLDAGAGVILERVSNNRERPLLRTEDPMQTVEDMLRLRNPLYKSSADEHIFTEDLTVDEISYGIAETARLWFSRKT